MPPKTTSFTYKTTITDEGQRLDVVLASRPEVASRSFGERLIKNGLVSVDERAAGKSYRVSAAQVITYQIPDPKEAEVEPENIPLDIVYEDADLAVINKQAGLVVHPSYGHWEGTLVNALLFHLKGLSAIGGVKRPGIVHRLDKNTSGLMLIAKNDKTHIALSEAIKNRQVQREYLALVHGSFKEKTFQVEAPIARHPIERKKMAVQPNGRYAKTKAFVLEQFEDYAFLKLRLVTGRTHQIRVHLFYINHPVVGDATYGRIDDKEFLSLTRQFLHAFHLKLKHPTTGKELEFEAELPPELKEVLRRV